MELHFAVQVVGGTCHLAWRDQSRDRLSQHQFTAGLGRVNMEDALVDATWSTALTTLTILRTCQ